MVLEMDQYLATIEPLEDNAAFNFVNALEDLLWAFELRATASWIFHLAIKRNIYRSDIFRSQLRHQFEIFNISVIVMLRKIV